MPTKIISGFFPKYKLHKVCEDDEFRPVMGYLYFKNGKVYATDAYIAIAAPLSFVSTFSDEEQKLLDGKLIHATQFAQLLTMRETKIELFEGKLCFVCTNRENGQVIFPLLDEDVTGRFPNVGAVIEEAKEYAKNCKQPVSHAGLNISLLVNLAAAMGARIVDLYFSSSSKAIVVEDGDGGNEIGAIIMPLIIQNPKY